MSDRAAGWLIVAIAGASLLWAGLALAAEGRKAALRDAGEGLVPAQGYGDALVNAVEKTRRLKCQSNLKQIWSAIDDYRQQFNGWPKDLEALVDKKLIDKKLLKCPSAKSAEGSIDYVLVPERDFNGGDIIVYDRKANHAVGRNVLQSDGTTQWLSSEKFKKATGDDPED